MLNMVLFDLRKYKLNIWFKLSIELKLNICHINVSFFKDNDTIRNVYNFCIRSNILRYIAGELTNTQETEEL